MCCPHRGTIHTTVCIADSRLSPESFFRSRHTHDDDVMASSHRTTNVPPTRSSRREVDRGAETQRRRRAKQASLTPCGNYVLSVPACNLPSKKAQLSRPTLKTKNVKTINATNLCKSHALTLYCLCASFKLLVAFRLRIEDIYSTIDHRRQLRLSRFRYYTSPLLRRARF